MTEAELKGNFALVTADKANNVSFALDGESSDCTSFMNWLSVWQGVLHSFDAMKRDPSILLSYKVVMFSGHPAHFQEIIKISKMLKGKVVTMFLPEGDACQYDRYGINSYASEVYQSWDAVDVLAIMEEDKRSYYESLTNSLVRFVHVPLHEKMAKGLFRTANHNKTEHILVYGDNNPNAPVTVFGVARRLNKPLKTVCIDDVVVDAMKKQFGVQIDLSVGKLSQFPFLRLLGSCGIHVYPTRWIGSAREPIACAVARTPCIGSDKSHTQRRLFPKLACDVYDVDKMCDLANKLYTDVSFYDEVVDYAWGNVQFYNMENTKKRFLDAVTEVEMRWK